jgi:hypothetical protein
MQKSKLPRVESKRPLIDFRGRKKARTHAVERVAVNGKPKMRHVNADLVQTTAAGYAGDKGMRSACRQDFDIGDGRLGAARDDAHEACALC